MPFISSRRALLKTFAGSTFAATAMKFFVRTADAATFPTRFVFVFTQHGRDTESLCTGTGPSFTLWPGLAALEPLRKKLTIVDGLSIPAHTGEEHPCGRSAMLTGRGAAASWGATGVSFDRYLANKLTAGRSVYAGIEPPNAGPEELNQPISWEGSNAPNNGFVQGPDALMKKLLPGMAPAPMMTAAAPSSGAADELALYDHLMAEVTRLQKVAPRSQADKLSHHLQALQQLASVHKAPAPGEAAPMLRGCEAPAVAAGADIDRMGQILAHALACGQTRVAVLSLGAYEPHHEFSHPNGEADRAQLRSIDKGFTQKFVTFLRALDSFAEGSGTLLDNTVVVWSSEMSGSYGDGGGFGHGTDNVPFVLAGGLGGKLKLGQRVVVNGRTSVDLYRMIATQMGVTKVDDYGDPKLAKGALTDLLA